jgi:hypothetical protein
MGILNYLKKIFEETEEETENTVKEEREEKFDNLE